MNNQNDAICELISANIAFLYLQQRIKESLVVAGLIIAVFELVMMLMIPLIGNYVRFFTFVL